MISDPRQRVNPQPAGAGGARGRRGSSEAGRVVAAARRKQRGPAPQQQARAAARVQPSVGSAGGASNGGRPPSPAVRGGRTPGARAPTPAGCTPRGRGNSRPQSSRPKTPFDTGGIAAKDEEGLDDDWEKSRWVIPSTSRALEHQKRSVWRHGRAPFCGTSLDEMTEMGAGVSLYFRVLKYSAVVFLVVSVVLAPTAILSYAGQRLAPEDVDALGFSKVTLGNLGVLTECDVGAAVGANCTDVGNERIAILGQEFTLLEAGQIVSLSDWLACIVFLLFIAFVRQQIVLVETMTNENHTTLADYSVFVRGLPADATDDEIIDHFNELYQLSEDDVRPPPCPLCCKNRVRPAPHPPLNPVEDVSNTNDEAYLHSWIAEATVVRTDGDHLRRFQRLEKHAQRLRVARAKVLKYRHDTPLAISEDGRTAANELKMAKALRKLRHIEADIEFTRGLVRRKGLEEKMASSCHGAFIVFEQQMSVARCLHDYRNSHSKLWRIFQPKPLRFRGTHPLNVQRAPEASNVLWENLDAGTTSKMCRRGLTALLTTVLLIGSFLVILEAQQSRRVFQQATPKLRDCNSHVFAAVHDRYPTTEELAAMTEGLDTRPVLVRNRTFECPTDAFYVWYDGAEATDLLMDESRQDLEDSCRSPCVPPSTSDRCSSLACEDPEMAEAAGVQCDEAGFLASTRVGCYCLQVLKETLEAEGIFSGAETLFNTEWDLCGEYSKSYAAAQSLTFAAAGSVIVINFVLKWVLVRMVMFERHASVTSQSVALAKKLFAASFTNTAILTLIVYARLPNDIEIPFIQSTVNIFNGEFDDINSRWYSAVGAAIALTLLINSFSPVVAPLADFCCLKGPRRKKGAKNMLTQRDMNDLYMGPHFAMAVQLAVLLNTVFSCLLYSGGMPALALIAFGALTVQYCVDKFLLLRYYREPEKYDATVIESVAGILPLALLGHLGVSIWMFGAPGVLESEEFSSRTVTGGGGGDLSISEEDAAAVSGGFDAFLNATAPYDPLGIGPRIGRVVVLPQAITFVLVVLYLIAGPLIRRVLSIALRVLTCGRLCRGRTRRIHEEDVSTFPFTGHWKAVASRNSKLTKHQQEAGWRLKSIEGTRKLVKVQVWTDPWPDKMGRTHEPETIKRTWEIIMTEHGLSSYHMLQNDKYARLKDVFMQMLPPEERNRRLAAAAPETSLGATSPQRQPQRTPQRAPASGNPKRRRSGGEWDAAGGASPEAQRSVRTPAMRSGGAATSSPGEFGGDESTARTPVRRLMAEAEQAERKRLGVSDHDMRVESFVSVAPVGGEAALARGEPLKGPSPMASSDLRGGQSETKAADPARTPGPATSTPLPPVRVPSAASMSPSHTGSREARQGVAAPPRGNPEP